MKLSGKICTLAAITILSTGCATKRYPIATPLSGAEIAAMNCRELQLEIIRAEQVQVQISNTAQMDWRSVAGFLGDYGIGNAMAKSEAEKAIRDRVASIRTAQTEKKCDGVVQQ
jgi:hypothetical protein